MCIHVVLRHAKTIVTAFNAFINTTVIIAQISFAVPAALLLLRRRNPAFLPPTRVFKIPALLGYLANSVCVAWAVVLTVFFTFPTEFPVTGGNMSMFFFFCFVLFFFSPFFLFPDLMGICM